MAGHFLSDSDLVDKMGLGVVEKPEGVENKPHWWKFQRQKSVLLRSHCSSVSTVKGKRARLDYLKVTGVLSERQPRKHEEEYTHNILTANDSYLLLVQHSPCFVSLCIRMSYTHEIQLYGYQYTTSTKTTQFFL